MIITNGKLHRFGKYFVVWACSLGMQVGTAAYRDSGFLKAYPVETIVYAAVVALFPAILFFVLSWIVFTLKKKRLGYPAAFVFIILFYAVAYLVTPAMKESMDSKYSPLTADQ